MYTSYLNYLNYLYLGILIILIILYFKKYHKNIFVKIKLYNIFSDYTFTSNKINDIEKNFQYNFKNCIYKFYNTFHLKISKHNIYNFIDFKTTKHKLFNSDFVNVLGFFNDSTFCKEYINLNVDMNDINNININKTNNFYQNEKFILNDINVESYLIDYIETNFTLYKKFVKMFNDIDTSIIKVVAYGHSGCGKTFFLKNINKILIKNDKFYKYNHGMYRNINNFINDSPKKFKKDRNIFHYIFHYILSSYGYNYVIHYINLNELDNFDKDFNKNIEIFFEIYNKLKLLDFKLILLCESDKNNDYYNNFDIIYKADYISNETKKNIENKFNFTSSLSNNIKINDIMTEILNKN